MVKNNLRAVAIDIRGAGVGPEGSARMLYGTIMIGEFRDSGPPKESAAAGIRRDTI